MAHTQSNVIRPRGDYIMGFIAPAKGPHKCKKLTRLLNIATQYLRHSLNEKQHAWLHTQQVTSPMK